MTASVTSSLIAGRPPCRSPRGRCPCTVPVTFDRPIRGEYATGTSSTRQPAAAARSTISSGQPKRRSRTPSARRSSASRRAHRPDVGDRQSGTAAQLGTRGTGSRVARGAASTARPAARAEHEVGLAGDTGAATAHEVGAGERSVAVHEAHDVRRCVQQSPRQHAAPKPRCGSATRRARRASGATCRRVVGRGVVDDDRVEAGRRARATPMGIAAASSSTGRITSGTIRT